MVVRNRHARVGLQRHLEHIEAAAGALFVLQKFELQRTKIDDFGHANLACRWCPYNSALALSVPPVTCAAFSFVIPQPVAESVIGRRSLVRADYLLLAMVRRTNHIRINRSDLPVCQVPFEKRFLLSPTPNHFQTMLILSRQKGRFANVSNAGQDAMDAGGFLDE